MDTQDKKNVSRKVKYSESLDAQNYLLHNRMFSKIDPSIYRHIEAGIICPRCRQELPVLHIVQRATCHSCDLVMTRHDKDTLLCTIEIEEQDAQSE